MSIFVQLACLLLLAAASCSPILADDQANRAPNPTNIETRVTTPDPTTSAAGEKIDKETVQHVSLLDAGQKARDEQRPVISQEPFGLQTFEDVPNELLLKWADLKSRLLDEEETLAACDRGDSNCPAAARRLISIIELGRQRQGVARLGEINRAVNLSIRPVSDWAQYGVEDFWSAPLATLSAGAGDCEDYAIVKYVAFASGRGHPR